jgi:all-trans-8'-apo-beta-carotenal 15,15'-oxygenase
MRIKKKLTRNPRSGAYDREEWSKAFVSQRDEFSYFIDNDSIEGKIPSDLSGSLFRNRPSLFERGTYSMTLTD